VAEVRNDLGRCLERAIAIGGDMQVVLRALCGAEFEGLVVRARRDR
jgi:hypothetical protein